MDSDSDQRRTHFVPNNIRSLRKRKQPAWRQADLAQVVGCSGSEIGKYERGERVPSLAVALRIALVLSRPMEEVFWGWRDQGLRQLRSLAERPAKDGAKRANENRRDDVHHASDTT